PVALTATSPVREQARTLRRVLTEEPGQSARHRIPSSSAQLRLDPGLVTAEVLGEGGCPGLVEAVVDRPQDRPGELLGVPGVAGLDAQDERNERVRVQEPDACAYAVRAGDPRCSGGRS